MTAKEAAQSSNGAALDAALVALRNHVDGTNTLSNTDLPTKAAIVKQHGSLLKQGGSYLTKAFDLVSAYEASSSGPLPSSRVRSSRACLWSSAPSRIVVALRLTRMGRPGRRWVSARST